MFPIVFCDRCAGVFAIVLCAMAALGGLSSVGVFATEAAGSSEGGAETRAAPSGQLAEVQSLLLSLRSGGDSEAKRKLLKQRDALEAPPRQDAMRQFKTDHKPDYDGVKFRHAGRDSKKKIRRSCSKNTFRCGFAMPVRILQASPPAWNGSRPIIPR